MKIPGLLVSLCCLIVNGVSGVGSDEVSVMEGDSVTLNTGVQTNQQDSITWYYNDIRIARITGDLSKICTDVQCNEGTERFRDRLKLDHQTGCLTITHTRNTDSGEYRLQISSGRSDSEKIFSVSVTDVSGADTDGVSVMEGDSVTLNTGVQTNQHEKITWYYKGNRIAQINRDQSKICTDVQCNEGTERFRDRLKLDHQTGSLTIMNITETDSGVLELRISNGSSDIEKIFSVSVHSVSPAERDEVKIKDGESVTLDPGLRRKTNCSMTWYFIDILIAEITGDQSQICTDVQCKERFRDRLKLDHQTGSLNITHTRNTDSGEYQLQIDSGRFSILKTFRVTVTAVPDPGLSSTAVGGICVIVILLVVAAGIYYLCRSKQTVRSGNGAPDNNNPQGNGLDQTPLNNNSTEAVTNATPLLQPEDPQTDAAKRTSLNQTTTPQTGPADTEENDVAEETTPNHTGSTQEAVANGTSH
ncbi:uncharacterized protein LOC143735195 [Siphateles boraxobius]|uniref:uncharacterized protein LOC143735195 n=1 Tax=Siphateles boraxobius TaxID=180520 RepID=UPI0040636B77